MKKALFVIIGTILSLVVFSCATQLPAFDPSLSDSETAILVIPKNILIVKMDDTNVGWESGKLRQIRIPAGKHIFYVNSEESVKVYDRLGVNALMGYTSNYITKKQWLGGTITHIFIPGNKYKITSKMYHRETFASQYVEYTITYLSSAYSNVKSTAKPQVSDSDNIAHAQFLGKWKYSFTVIDISETEITITGDRRWGDDPFSYTIRIDDVTPIKNKGSTRRDYPNGFSFSGVIINKTGNINHKVGDTVEKRYYLHKKTGNSFTDRGTNFEFYIKQP